MKKFAFFAALCVMPLPYGISSAATPVPASAKIQGQPATQSKPAAPLKAAGKQAGNSTSLPAAALSTSSRSVASGSTPSDNGACGECGVAPCLDGITIVKGTVITSDTIPKGKIEITVTQACGNTVSGQAKAVGENADQVNISLTNDAGLTINPSSGTGTVSFSFNFGGANDPTEVLVTAAATNNSNYSSGFVRITKNKDGGKFNCKPTDFKDKMAAIETVIGQVVDTLKVAGLDPKVVPHINAANEEKCDCCKDGQAQAGGYKKAFLSGSITAEDTLKIPLVKPIPLKDFEILGGTFTNDMSVNIKFGLKASGQASGNYETKECGAEPCIYVLANVTGSVTGTVEANLTLLKFKIGETEHELLDAKVNPGNVTGTIGGKVVYKSCDGGFHSDVCAGKISATLTPTISWETPIEFLDGEKSIPLAAWNYTVFAGNCP